MKKILVFLFLIPIGIVCAQQSIIVTFTGRNLNTDEYMQLSRVEISNPSQGWTQMLYYPDTVAIFTPTGLSEYELQQSSLRWKSLLNPFHGSTNAVLYCHESGPLNIVLTDMSGRILSVHHEERAQIGQHHFRINAGTPGMFVLTAYQNGVSASIKLVNTENGSNNTVQNIQYVGMADEPDSPDLVIEKGGASSKGQIEFPFTTIDGMSYQGFSSCNGDELYSERIQRMPIYTEDCIFHFDCGDPLPRDTNPNNGTPCHDTPFLTDYDGNVYETVQIGSQCWMRENLRTTHYADGRPLMLGDTAASNHSAFNYPYGDSTHTQLHGLLYNWATTMDSNASSSSNPSGVQGLCPNGWHIPSQEEWHQLIDYIDDFSNYVCGNGYTARALAAKEGWRECDCGVWTCSIAFDPTQNNATGFSATGAGYCLHGNSTPSYPDFGFNTAFWSSTKEDAAPANAIRLRCNYPETGEITLPPSLGLSVRCLRD
ncbi:MAG: fibrobacter succinogenes major paralogous domain-containing protein [Bacteroidales bacterium]|nr:fibrobacter succinogenes major paralogous domain-containing protein [Bacteroidales bacterium]